MKRKCTDLHPISISQSITPDAISDDMSENSNSGSYMSDTQNSIVFECIDLLHNILHKEWKLEKRMHKPYLTVSKNDQNLPSIKKLIKQINDMLQNASSCLKSTEYYYKCSKELNEEKNVQYLSLLEKYNILKSHSTKLPYKPEANLFNYGADQNEKSEFDSTVLNLQNKVIALQSSLTNTENDNRDLKRKIKELDEHNSYLEGIIYNFRHDYKLKYTRKSTKTGTCKFSNTKERTFSELSKKYHELKIKAITYKNTIEELRNANLCLENRLQSHDTSKLREALIHSDGINQGMKTSIDALERRLGEIEKENSELNRENAALSQQVEVLQHALDANAAFSGQMNAIMKRNAELEELLLQAKEDYGKKTLELEDRLEGKESDIEAKERQIATLQSALEQSQLEHTESRIADNDCSLLRAELETAKSEINEKEKEIQNLKILHKEELLKLEEEHAKEIERLKSNRNSEELYRETIAGQQERIEHLVKLLTRSEEVIAILRAIVSGDPTENNSYESQTEEESVSEIKTPINSSKEKTKQSRFDCIDQKKSPAGIIKKTKIISDSYIDRLCEEKRSKVKIIGDKKTQGLVLERKPSSAYFKEIETPRIIKRGYYEPDLKRELEEMQNEIAQIKAEINDSAMAPSLVNV